MTVCFIICCIFTLSMESTATAVLAGLGAAVFIAILIAIAVVLQKKLLQKDRDIDKATL